MVATSTGCESSVVGLKPMWAPQGVTVPHRCNGDARADAPQGTVGHIESDGGLVQQNGQAAVPRFFPRPRGNPGLTGYRGRRAVARGNRRRHGRHLPCRAGHRNREEASRRNRACGQRWKRRAAAAALDGSENWRRGHYAASAAVPRVLVFRAADRPSQLSSPTPAPDVSVAHAGGAADSTTHLSPPLAGALASGVAA